MGDPARAPWPWVIRDLPPGWTIEDLQVVAQAALAAFTGFSDNWCAEGSDAALAALHARGHRDVRFCYGGCAVDPTHAYLALQSPDPRWDGAILDPTIRQFIVSPDASVVQRAQVSGYPRCPQVPTVAVVPPWHPFYRRLRYSPDPNVETLADPRDPFFEADLFSAAWIPSSGAPLWGAFCPMSWIAYPTAPWAVPARDCPAAG